MSDRYSCRSIEYIISPLVQLGYLL